ncbi:CLK4-associating serine/arginine rich protein-like [Mya arenaria]|uniref:CLK4-associating serine/arginine rich protein-like n=1 Tax=Mya arenaria TaxID=6604 RepID=UPI0022E71CF5|nr:CLK4-associating serine/arginine rich protein-like [Mya arenaria]
MWHEARRQEKKIRGLMVDYKKRAQRRREFYEKIKADPAQFVRVFGQTCKINLDPAISIAAESPQTMMPWQDDKSNMIDRFDVRAHLDIMPPEKSYPIKLTKDEEKEDRKANYERYRILVENECGGLSEEQALHQLYLDEQFGAISKDGEEEKNKLKDKKAAIGYTYDDSTEGPSKDKGSDESESEEEDIETFDLDVVLDVDTLTDEQIGELNLCGIQFGMGKKDYVKYLRRDKDEQEAIREAKQLEEEKAQFAGRKSRRERRMFKEKRLAGRKLSPPSYAARSSPKYEPYRRSTSRSRSRSHSPPRRRRKKYITSFGGNESDEGEGVVQGPALPPGFGAQSDSTNTKPDASCESKARPETLRQRLRKSLTPEGSVSPRTKDIEYLSKTSRSRSRDRKSGRSRSDDRKSGRSRSPRSSRSRRSRSRERFSRDRYSRDRRSRDRLRRSRSRGRRSRSRDRIRRSRSRDRSRRSRSRDRWRRSRSHDRARRSRSRDRRRSYSRRSRSKSRRSKSRSRSRKISRSRSRTKEDNNRSRKSRSKSSSSRASSKSSRRSASKSKSPVKVVRSYRREATPSSSDLSEDESKATSDKSSDKSPASQTGAGRGLVPYGKPSSISQVKLTPQERLKKRMQIALSKQYKADKKAEVQRHEKMEQEKLDREEELRLRAMEMRRREREKRHREQDDGGDSSDDDRSSHGSTPRRRRKDEDRSPLPKQYARSPSRREGRGSPTRREKRNNGTRGSDDERESRRSRSKSESPVKMKIVDY